MFDYAEITVKGGDGGSGAISFRKEKFVPFGGPDGGDGGTGGSVLIVADQSVTDLGRFRQVRSFRAARGDNGKGQRKHGKMGDDLRLAVPPGTVVSRRRDRAVEVLADLERDGQEVIAARGGKGGHGNARYASSTNQAPRIAERGEEGETAELFLEMRLIADAGIIGYPNVGKSSLLAAASAARPKVADYPFTTLEPVLGVVEAGGRNFVLAEIPGLIQDAHLGRGLGLDFLKHVLRTKMLIHLLDGSSEDPAEDMIRVNNELGRFHPALRQLPQLVAVNKVDLPEVAARAGAIKEAFREAGLEVTLVSAATGEGVPGLMSRAARMLARLDEEAGRAPAEVKVFRPQPRRSRLSVRKDGDIYVISAPSLERLVSKEGDASPELHWQMRKRLVRLGANKALAAAGLQPGDRVRIGRVEMEW